MKQQRFKFISLLVALSLFFSSVPFSAGVAADTDSEEYAYAVFNEETYGGLMDEYYYLTDTPENVINFNEGTYSKGTEQEYTIKYLSNSEALFELSLKVVDTVTVNYEGYENSGILWKRIEVVGEYDESLADEVAAIKEYPWVFQNFTGDDYKYGWDSLLIFDQDVTLIDMPGGCEATWNKTATDDVSVAVDSIVDYSMYDYQHYNMPNVMGVDLSLFNKDGNEYQPIDDEKTITVHIDKAWDAASEIPTVDVYHILDYPKAIEAAHNKDTAIISTDASMIEAYSDEASIAEDVLGYKAVVYEILSSRSGAVTLCDDGSISFEMDSFSTIIITSGTGKITISGSSSGGQGNGGATTSYSYEVYMVAGTDVAVTLPVTKDNITSSEDADNSTSISHAYDSESSSDSTAVYKITAEANANVDETATFTYEWSTSTTSGKRPGNGNNNGTTTTTYTATVTAYIIDKNDVGKYTSLTNTIDHIQINVKTVAVILDSNSNPVILDDIDLGFSSDIAEASGVGESYTYRVVKIEDLDSKVGYYYQYTYTGTNNVETTITIRVDESIDYGVDLTSDEFKFDITNVTYENNNSGGGTSSSSSQNQISFDGTFTIGTKGNQIQYVITVETTYTGKSTAVESGTDLTFSTSIGYWDEENVCPGISSGGGNGQSGGNSGDSWENGGVVNGSGIDVAEFSTGYKDEEGKINYVVYSNLTKIVTGDNVFSDSTTSRNYTFTIYRSATGESDWTAVETVSITLTKDDQNNDGTYSGSTTLTADASKYVEYMEGYDYMIKETGYNINGYDCMSSFGEGYEFEWEKTTSDDETVIVYSVELSCTNTYTKKIAGLAVTKNVVDKNGNAVDTEDLFTVKLQPTRLELEGDAGTNSYSKYNSGTYTYKIGANGDEQTIKVTGGSETAYGEISFSVKGGETYYFVDLPEGTYNVWEVEDPSNTNYTYDTTVHSVTLIDSASVTITNTYIQKTADLTIIKQAGADTTIGDDETFVFHVQGGEVDMIVTVQGAGPVTVADLPIGAYTVTEQTDWSWRYTPVENAKSVTLDPGTTNTVTFVNTRDKTDWLDANASADNIFTGIHSESA